MKYKLSFALFALCFSVFCWSASLVNKPKHGTITVKNKAAMTLRIYSNSNGHWVLKTYDYAVGKSRTIPAVKNGQEIVIEGKVAVWMNKCMQYVITDYTKKIYIAITGTIYSPKAPSQPDGAKLVKRWTKKEILDCFDKG